MSTSRLGLADAWGKLRHVRFNQDQSCFVCSFEDGVRIYNVDPIRECAHFRIEDVGSVSCAEMLFRTNILAMVSGGSRPMFADDKVMIYDDHRSKFVLEVSAGAPVLGVRLKRDKLVIICRRQIHVFSFPNRCQKLFSISTRDNPYSLCEVSPMRLSQGCDELMVIPGYRTGSLQLVNMTTTEQKVSSAPVTINAHQNELGHIAINQKGTMIASASTKGTLIRIWDPVQMRMLVELRRGSDSAMLYCISFSMNNDWLCCSSDKGTVHVFALQDYSLNKRSALASMGVPGKYIGSQWSLANFTVPQEVACVCAFGRERPGALGHTQGTINAVCLDGSFHKYHFSADGVCNQVDYDVFTDLCEDCEWLDLVNH